MHAEIHILVKQLIYFLTQKLDHWRRKKVARARGSENIVVSIGHRHVCDIATTPSDGHVAYRFTTCGWKFECVCWIMFNVAASPEATAAVAVIARALFPR